MTPLFALLFSFLLPQLAAFSCSNHVSRPACLRPTSALFLSTDGDADDLDSLLSDDDSSSSEKLVSDFDLTKENLPFQTDGGVIMPEGGANPCVIKVLSSSLLVWCNDVL